MPIDQRLCNLVRSIERGIGGGYLLKGVADAYGLSHAAYLRLHLPRAAPNEPIVCMTYPESSAARDWARTYAQCDPVIHQSLASVFPTDWASFPLSAEKVRVLFGEAREFGLGAHGITFPIQGRGKETALFSVASNVSAEDWLDFKRENLASLQILAFYIHQSIPRSINGEKVVAKLSPREIECLKWAADGKTFTEIAKILSLSERRIRFYLDVARHKLHCLNIAHTVACTIIMDIIPPPF
jgi:DNA-binding CsgD family transcriptional regulator